MAQTLSKTWLQVQLILWKRWREMQSQRTEIPKLVLVPLAFLSICVLMYCVFPIFNPGGAEPLIIPIGFWLFIQRIVVLTVYEKHNRLLEAMKMMGLNDISYYIGYFLSEGVIAGFIISLCGAILSMAHSSEGDFGYVRYGDHHLFNNGSFGSILGLFFTFCLAAVPFGFFLSSLFDNPQTAGQATLLILLAFYVIYIVLVKKSTTNETIIALCFFPPLGLQIGAASYLNSYEYENKPPLSTICGIQVLNVFIYSFLAWYLTQVIPSSVGVAKPWYFLFDPSYWVPAKNEMAAKKFDGIELSLSEQGHTEIHLRKIPEEEVDEKFVGKPSIVIKKLRKTFESQVAVNNVSFNMYENQIFVLLGHNGAGKSTTINMLSGLFKPDYDPNTSASIYGRSIIDDMDDVRHSLGICPQHDVLFDNLTVRDHILLFSQIKGFSYEEAEKEVQEFTSLFHLDQRLDHTGSELSGGQKRKLSVAIAVCGGSKFIIFDEPTAGMDPLARRELWDLLTVLRKGRTMLLTTHYMDEADVLGDRVAIMNIGKIQCIGSTTFLKKEYGVGYKLAIDKAPTFDNNSLSELTKFVMDRIPTAKFSTDLSADYQVHYNLPFSSSSLFGQFFEDIGNNFEKLRIENYGITLTSLEDVFLKVGEDHSVTPKSITDSGIGSNKSFNATFFSQSIGITIRRLKYAMHDYVTLPLVLIPMCSFIIAGVLSKNEIVSKYYFYQDLTSCGLYYFAFLGLPGLIAEFIVRERSNKLRNVLTVMGCDLKAYWLGNLLADLIILLPVIICLFISWSAADMTDFSLNKEGLGYFVIILSVFQILAFSYLCSFMFTSPVKCMIFMPLFNLLLLVLPMILITIYAVIQIQVNGAPDSHYVRTYHNNSIYYYDDTLVSNDDGALRATPGYVQWGIMILSPQGALFCALLDISVDLSLYINSFPNVSQTIGFMIAETILFFAFAFYIDSVAIREELPTTDPSFDESVLHRLDEDVKAERAAVNESVQNLKNFGWSASLPSLVVSGLRKLFPAKKSNTEPVTAVENLSFQVAHGEIFGLLGANGAGKTTCLSILTRHLSPTAGDAFVAGNSVLSKFSAASANLGVVTQNNSLWDLLSVEDHLFLFARLRGVPEDIVESVVSSTIDQLELTPHRQKLACKLSGGMKRKLCVAIALIGDPSVVLLDEPSAGLDPVSRRNLWTVILRTMSHRSVVLTTHSMEEAEALCGRIGIMVKGQLRVIGTKQHLKVKFSSGYELAAKLNPGHDMSLDDCLGKFASFIKSIFPRAIVIASNSSLVTYRVPKEEMNIPLAFKSIEANKDSLRIEDYSISQPTLEQIFISTVVDNSGDDFLKQRLSVSEIGGSLKMHMENTDAFRELNPDQVEEPPKPKLGPTTDDEMCTQLCCPDNNIQLKCGCPVKKVHYALYVSWTLFVVFSIIIFASRGKGLSPAVTFSSFIIFIISLVLCCVGCCPCMRKDPNEEE